MTTLWADVSEWQTGVTDAYPYRMLCIRSNDGTYRDKKWANNYGWCRKAADAGKLDCFIVYLVYRPNWRETLDTFRSQVGAVHPKMIVMVDVESWGGQIGGNHSAGINLLIDGIAQTLGDRRRVIAYGNQGDLNSLWPAKPDGIRLIVAGYSKTKPNYPGQIGWQYTDGSGFGPGPQGAAPFGNCDMNQTDLSTTDFAAQCGVDEGVLDMSTQDTATVVSAGRQLDKPSSTVRKAPAWLARFLPKSFRDPAGPWVRDEIDAIVNEVVTGTFDLTTPIDFGDGKIYAPKDVPPDTPVNFVTLLRVIGARQAVAQGLIK